MPEVKKFLDGINQTLLPWQEYVLTQLLAVDKKNKFKKKTSLLLVARQSGKTHLARIRILAGLFVFGEKNIVAMSSNRGMALDTFRKVVEVIEDNPSLMAQVKQIRVANGQESVELLSGCLLYTSPSPRDS